MNIYLPCMFETLVVAIPEPPVAKERQTDRQTEEDRDRDRDKVIFLNREMAQRMGAHASHARALGSFHSRGGFLAVHNPSNTTGVTHINTHVCKSQNCNEKNSDISE